ncbi:MAG: primosomal protein N' [Actinobacteria bacterium]|nr:primosomal protein N' [Actinomycetota bacterium]
MNKDILKKQYAEVIVDISAFEVDRPFTYKIPEKIKEKISIGSMALVPFSKRQQVGFVIGFTEESDIAELSEIEALLDESPVFNEEMVNLCHFVADYYLSPLSGVLKLVFPPGRTRSVTEFICLNKPLPENQKLASFQKEILDKLESLNGKVLRKDLNLLYNPSSLAFALKKLEEKSFVSKTYEVSKPKIEEKTEQYVKLNQSKKTIREYIEKQFKKSPKKTKILKYLMEENKEISVKQAEGNVGISRAVLNQLSKEGYISFFKKAVKRRIDDQALMSASDNIILNKDQKTAVEKIFKSLNENKSDVFLLEGVTGSGKTEVYLRAIEEVLRLGKTAIVLVPEIILTPQTIERFKSRFGETVAILHSHLTAGQRFDQWMGIRKGEYKVVIGVRSAVFAPLENLGLIVVDEEHESSYKQNRNPRYHAREVAVKRAEFDNAVVVLGSATPSLESKYKAEEKMFNFIGLSKRVENRIIPEIEIVDMREEQKAGNKTIFSNVLQEAIKDCLKKDEKIILFLNRRGYSSFIMCYDCGYVVKCKRCSVSMTYHQQGKLLRCHHCDYIKPAPEVCPNCESRNIGYFGIGTQRVESELKTLFPETNIVRVDRDSVSRKDSHYHKLKRFSENKKSILLGTQMIAKGLDFPEVTLVGIINSDTVLNLPDFRAAEKTFQLVMQVSGRAGRGALPGRVVAQTYSPESYAIESLKNGDYNNFWKQEVAFRKELDYPPFSNLINLLVSGDKENETEEASEAISKFFRESGFLDSGDLIQILGPAPAPLYRIMNRYRWHILLKVRNPDKIKKFIKLNLKSVFSKKLFKNVNLIIDVDPVWVL